MMWSEVNKFNKLQLNLVTQRLIHYQHPHKHDYVLLSVILC